MTDDGVPTVQRLADGMVRTGTPFAVPHPPLIGLFALQLIGFQVLYPRQSHVHGPAPATALASHFAQRLIVGAVVTLLL